MKIIKNEKLIERNGKIGNWISLGALAVLGIGMYISFTKPELFSYSIVALIAGFVMTQVGMYLGNKFGRSPRPDEKIDSGLKGLHSDFNMYHYSAPVSHLLVGPTGIWAILPYHQRGKIAFAKNRWRISGGGFMQGYMRIFGQESLGRPELDAESQVQTIRKFLAKKMETAEIPEIKAALIFTNDDAEVDAGESQIPAMKIKQLKEFLRQGAKSRILSSEQIANINEIISGDK